MNCKPGDLAIVIRGRHSGKLVDVLRAAPFHNFLLPDGIWNEGEPSGACWVVKILGTPVWVDIYGHPNGGRFASYGTAADAWLRPLRGQPSDEHIDEAITA